MGAGNLRRPFLFLLVSICLHLLVLVPFFIFLRGSSPLPGGDRDSEVSIEIVGEDAGGSPSDGPASLGDKVNPRNSSSERRAASDFSSPGPGSGPSGGADSVLAEIRAQIERAKRYPMLARRSEIEGVALVGFLIDASGRPESVRLKSSSGHPVLDDEALATIRRAAPFPPYSKPLEIGIRFELKP